MNLGKFNTEKVVSFVPPDGEFELMKYRCQDNIVLPFRILPIINEIGRTRLEAISHSNSISLLLIVNFVCTLCYGALVKAGCNIVIMADPQ